MVVVVMMVMAVAAIFGAAAVGVPFFWGGGQLPRLSGDAEIRAQTWGGGEGVSKGGGGEGRENGDPRTPGGHPVMGQ